MNKAVSQATFQNMPLSVGACATLACLWEAMAPKPGNVHRGTDFEDLTFADFAASAAVVGPILDRCQEIGVGQTVLAAVQATRQAVGTNTNLGTLLLLAPLAAVDPSKSLADGIGKVLAGLTADDTRDVYQAIAAAHPGGLGNVDQADVRAEPPNFSLPNFSLIEVMRLAEDRDTVARQFTNGFHDVLHGSAARIESGVQNGWPLADAIVHAQIRLLAERPDSLIARKRGPAIAQEASDRAGTILKASHPGQPLDEDALAEFDFWLRSDGHRRNPGTTADLIAAGLFVLLRERRLEWPVAFYSSQMRAPQTR